MGVAPITVPQSLAYVLNNAGDKSNVDFDYLVQTAMRESSLDPEAKAPSSSAVGLFQFLDSTWLQVMKEEGPRLGYQKYADAITRDSDGDYVIKDKALRAEVLKLRENPQIAADMAAAFTQSNGEYLKAKFGRMPSPGELYIAHFLGPQGAEKLFNAGLDNPDQIAAKLFPRQAKANPQIFYADGKARTIREVYKALVAAHNGIVATPLPGESDPAFVAQQLATADPPPADQVPSRFGPQDMSFTGLFSTEGPSTPQPLLAIGDAIAASGSAQPDALGFAPLPAPAPLIAPPAPSNAAADTPDVPIPTGAPEVPEMPSIPKPRVLMGANAGVLFLTQLYGAGGS